MEKAVHECRVCDVDISAVADGFFQAVCQVSIGVQRPFYGYGHARSDTVYRDDHVNVFRLEPAQNGSLSATGLRRRHGGGRIVSPTLLGASAPETVVVE